MQPAPRLDHVAKRAVDAIAHQGARLEDFEVDVGGALADRLRQQRVDEADDGRVVLGLEEVRDLGQRFGELGEVEGLAHVLDDRLGGVGLARVGECQAVLELLRRHQDLAQGLAGHAAHLGERGRLRHRAQPHLERAARDARGDHALGFREGVGQQADGRGVQFLGVHRALEGCRHFSAGSCSGATGGNARLRSKPIVPWRFLM